MSYQYICPTSEGYTQFKIKPKDHNRILIHRKINLFIKYEYFVKDKTIIMHQIPSMFSRILSTILFPLSCLIYGIFNIKSIFRESIVDMWFYKKYGSFIKDVVYKRDEPGCIYDKLMMAKK